jgi:hypothetical protein
MGLFFHYVVSAISWLEPITILLGLGISVWAFRRCRKRGYLLIGAYFALWFFSITILPSIKQHIRAKDSQYERSRETQDKINALHMAHLTAIDDVLLEAGQQPRHYDERSIDFNLGLLLLVLGLWFIARRETSLQQTQQG